MALSEEQFKRLSSGVSLLQQAIKQLVMTPTEADWLKKVLTRNETLLSDEKAERKAHALKLEMHKKEVERRAKLEREKQKQEIQEMHAKSGFSTYVVKLPGSFGSGKS